MTCLLEGFRTKKELIEASRLELSFNPWIEDPSIFNPYSGRALEYMKDRGITSFPVCLDHPKRLKFALITLRNNHLTIS